MRRIAALVSLVIALILGAVGIASVRDRAESASDNIHSSFGEMDQSAIQEQIREGESERNSELFEFVAAGAFIVVGLALFASERHAGARDEADDNLSLLK